MRLAACFLAASLVPLAAFSPAASAQDAAAVAAQRYDAGMKAWNDHRYVEAALFFEAATAERASAEALYTAALAWEQANAPDRAADDFVRALAVPGLQPNEQSTAQQRLAALEPVLGRIEVTAPDGWFVQIDSNSEVATPATLHATPGVHALAVRAPNRAIERRPVHLAMGETTKLELKDEPPKAENDHAVAAEASAPHETAPSPAAAPAAQESVGAHVRRTVGLVTIGFGVATLAAGAVLGFQALDARDAYNARPTQAGFDHADALQSWTNIAFIAGGVLTAGGVVLALWPFKFGGEAKATTEPPKEARLSLVPAPLGAALRGSF